MVRCSQSDAGLLGIDRDAENDNARRGGRGRGRTAGGRVPARPGDARDRLPAGHGARNESFADAGVLARAADACRRLHAGPRFTGDFDMFERQAAYLAIVKERGFDLPATYDDHADAWAQVRRALAADPRPTVPCNNDLLAANFIDTGEVGLADRLRVLRQQRRLLRAGQHLDRVRLHAGADRGLHRGVLRDADAGRPRPGPAPGAVQPVRLVALGLHPGGDQPARLRLPRLGHGALRQGRGDLPRRRTSTGC